MNKRQAKQKEAQRHIAAVTEILEATEEGRLLTRVVETKPDGTVIVTETYSPPQWQAAAWWLERTDPKHWGRK